MTQHSFNDFFEGQPSAPKGSLVGVGVVVVVLATAKEGPWGDRAAWGVAILMVEVFVVDCDDTIWGFKLIRKTCKFV